jgi:hypothetical protein
VAAGLNDDGVNVCVGHELNRVNGTMDYSVRIGNGGGQ